MSLLPKDINFKTDPKTITIVTKEAPQILITFSSMDKLHITHLP